MPMLDRPDSQPPPASSPFADAASRQVADEASQGRSVEQSSLFPAWCEVRMFDARVPLRAWKNVAPDANGGCWLWVACVDKHGYGALTVQGRRQLAHRFFFASLRGPLDAALVLDHRCRVRCCVNPAHLEQVTQATNVRRAPSSLKTECKRGHLLEGGNLRRTVTGRRSCLACYIELRRRNNWYRKSPMGKAVAS